MSKDEIVFGQVLLKYVCPCSQIDCGHKISSHVPLPIYGALPVGLTCKPLFPQEFQSPQSFLTRKWMFLPISYHCLLLGIHLLVIIVQNYFHSLSVFIILLQRYDFIFIYRAIPPAFLISIEENAGKIFGGNKNIAYLCS